MAIFLGCDEKADQEIINKIWNKTLEITQANPNTPMPKILFLEKDFYNELLKNNCSLYEGEEKAGCERNLKKIDKQLIAATKKNHKKLYGKYI